MEAQGSPGVCVGLQGRTVAELPLTSPELLGEGLWGPEAGVEWGRQTVCLGILFPLALEPSSESVSRDQAEGIFQLDQLLSRNRIKWERGMFHSGLESPGGFFDLPSQSIHASGRAA